MYKRLTFLAVGLLIALAVACNGSSAESETREDSFAVGEAPFLVINNDNGGIIVRSGADATVAVNAVLRNPDRIEYQISQDGDVINIEAKSDSLGVFDFGGSPGADLEITAPAMTIIAIMLTLAASPPVKSDSIEPMLWVSRFLSPRSMAANPTVFVRTSPKMPPMVI